MGKKIGSFLKRKGSGRAAASLLAVTMLTGCGGGAAEPPKLTGSCEEILNEVYEKAELDEGLREAMETGYYETAAIDEGMKEYFLGTNEVEYTDSVCSVPMMSSTAYQCVILRVPEGTDVVKTKQLLLDNADPRKWICVEAESVVVESVGDVILYLMADQATADAVKDAFLSLSES